MSDSVVNIPLKYHTHILENKTNESSISKFADLLLHSKEFYRILGIYELQNCIPEIVYHVSFFKKRQNSVREYCAKASTLPLRFNELFMFDFKLRTNQFFVRSNSA